MLFATLLILGTAAEAKPVKYAGVHPRTGNPSDGLCHIQFVHVHPYAPANASVLYRMHAGAYFFIGDPAPFGYEGPRHQYYGHHPVEISVVLGDGGGDHVEYCYLDGPHFHSYAPPPGQKFVEKEKVHYYADQYAPAYEQAKPEMGRINVIYRPWTYTRPVVVEPPPPAYRGPIIQIGVHVPVPAVGVHVGVPVIPVGHVHHAHCGHAVILVKDKHHKHKKFKHKKFKWKD
jgi:hypothetical protein